MMTVFDFVWFGFTINDLGSVCFGHLVYIIVQIYFFAFSVHFDCHIADIVTVPFRVMLSWICTCRAKCLCSHSTLCVLIILASWACYNLLCSLFPPEP